MSHVARYAAIVIVFAGCEKPKSQVSAPPAAPSATTPMVSIQERSARRRARRTGGKIGQAMLRPTLRRTRRANHYILPLCRRRGATTTLGPHRMISNESLSGNCGNEAVRSVRRQDGSCRSIICDKCFSLSPRKFSLNHNPRGRRYACSSSANGTSVTEEHSCRNCACSVLGRRLMDSVPGRGRICRIRLAWSGFEIMSWFMETRYWKAMHGQSGGETGIDNQMAEKAFENLGAWILGRNMFGPIRGEWPDENWRGWWGDEPPYHVPVFVLTHYPRASLVMKGGTTFHFVTGGIEEALKRAKEAAGDRDVRLGGGVSTVRQYLTAGLLDEVHLAVRPVLMGDGENSSILQWFVSHSQRDVVVMLNLGGSAPCRLIRKILRPLSRKTASSHRPRRSPTRPGSRPMPSTTACIASRSTSPEKFWGEKAPSRGWFKKWDKRAGMAASLTPNGSSAGRSAFRYNCLDGDEKGVAKEDGARLWEGER